MNGLRGINKHIRNMIYDNLNDITELQSYEKNVATNSINNNVVKVYYINFIVRGNILLCREPFNNEKIRNNTLKELEQLLNCYIYKP